MIHNIENAHKFQKIYIEKEVKDTPIAKNIMTNTKVQELIFIDDIRDIIERSIHPYPEDKQGFKELLVGKQRGPFVKPCPCSRDTMQCGYYYVDIGLGCPIDCSYCFLQGFLNTSFPVIYANTDKLEEELQILEDKQKVVRLGTGEMTDSLVFEPITEFAKYIIKKFEKWPHLIFELKTKSIFIDKLLSLHVPNVILSWSLMPHNIAKIEEPLAPSPLERIKAAKKACDAGYYVAFHFDPIIAYPTWEKDYHTFLGELLSLIPIEKIAWISLGTFRIFPALRETMRRRHKNSNILFNEFITGYDGKLRYFIKKRIDIYTKCLEWINQAGERKIPVYLCMESPEVWKKVGLCNFT